MHSAKHGFVARRAIAASLALMLGVGVAAVSSAAATTGDTISGVVWHDYDADGVRAPYEDALAGARVQATDGTTRSAVATTAANGQYSISVPTDASHWRVEAWLPNNEPRWDGYQPAVTGNGTDPSNGSAVQFVQVGTADAAAVDFSFQLPRAYTPLNPHVYLPELQFGPFDGPSAAETAGTTVRWDTVRADAYPHISDQTAQPLFRELGATHGTTVVGGETVLTSAWVRRHVGLGPAGVGGIYTVTPTSAQGWSGPTAQASRYLDLADPIYGIDLGGPDPAVRPLSVADDPQSEYEWERDGEGFRYVSQSGLGQIAMGLGDRFLYVVNLNTRSLIRVDTHNDLGRTPEPADVTEFFFPTLFPTQSQTVGAREDVRPYGISLDPISGRLYLTGTDTAETENEAAKQLQDHILRDRAEEAARQLLHGYVYSFDPEALDSVPDRNAADAVLTEELSFGLNYSRDPDQHKFRPWNLTARTPAPLAVVENEPLNWPEPMVSTVQILHGEMIIGIRDRSGDAYGSQTKYYPEPPADSAQDYNVIDAARGDLLKATLRSTDPSGARTWDLEQSGVAGGVNGAGVDGHGGPGGSTFFDTDWADHHTSHGLITTNPSRPDGVLGTSFEVDSYGETGTRRYKQQTGEALDGAFLRDSVDPWINGEPESPHATYKGNGLGQPALLAAQAPIEIGNRIWYDTDTDGVQDPDEGAVPGVTVHLYTVEEDGSASNQAVAAATADELGQYYFSSTATDYALLAGTDYIAAVNNPADYAAADSDAANPAPAGPLYGSQPTVANSGDAGASDRREQNDSDGVVDTASEFSSYPFVRLRTGAPGANDHSYDFGFAIPTPTPEPEPTPTPTPDPEPTIDPTSDPTVDPTPDPTIDPAPDPEPDPAPTIGPLPQPSIPVDPLPITGSDPSAAGVVGTVAALTIALGVVLAICRRRRSRTTDQ